MMNWRLCSFRAKVDEAVDSFLPMPHRCYFHHHRHRMKMTTSTMMQQQEQDYCCDVSMASLAVRSPVDADMEGTITTLQQQKSNFRGHKNPWIRHRRPTANLQVSIVREERLCQTPPGSSREQVPMIPSRQLHGALERCARDEHDVSRMDEFVVTACVIL